MRRRREQRMRQQQVQQPGLQQKPVQQALQPERERLQEPRQAPERAQELLPSCRKRRGRRQRSR
jgi:hypothetical protein